ncbi:MAG: LamG domain-containing protein [Actinomycetales bacterium]|nr:MAG: LamG domain-containing protein [Actinomycetales bacterium]
MKFHRTIGAVAGSAAIAVLATVGQGAQGATRSAYSAAVMADKPSAVLSGARDLVSGSTTGRYHGNARSLTMPNGDVGTLLDGRGDYVSFPSSGKYSIAATGRLTVEYLMRPDTLQFPDQEGSGYVYVLGKGAPTKHEWYGRMYSKVNAEKRPNRISGYAFNPKGGLGAGSYTQDTVTAGRWIHVTLVFNAAARSSRYPLGYVKIYRNGVLRDTDSLADYKIRPVAGSAPLRVGTGYLASFFDGAVGPVAFYPRELSASRIAAHNAAR